MIIMNLSSKSIKDHELELVELGHAASQNEALQIENYRS
jgi:hypothetical protein